MREGFRNETHPRPVGNDVVGFPRAFQRRASVHLYTANPNPNSPRKLKRACVSSAPAASYKIESLSHFTFTCLSTLYQGRRGAVVAVCSRTRSRQGSGQSGRWLSSRRARCKGLSSRRKAHRAWGQRPRSPRQFIGDLMHTRCFQICHTNTEKKKRKKK